MSAAPDLVLLPGLGADPRQFEAQRRAFPSLRTPSWIANREGESLAEYAARMVEQVGLTPGSVIGGSSFGGMVALEMARRVRPRAVILIGSCRSPKSVRPVVSMAGSLATWIPECVVNGARVLAMPLSRIAGPAPREVRRQIVEMSRGSTAGFMKWAGRAITTWTGFEDPDLPVRAIHGARDRVIPSSAVHADRVVPGAGHLLNMTHAPAVNAFIAEVLAGV